MGRASWEICEVAEKAGSRRGNGLEYHDKNVTVQMAKKN